MVGGLLSKLAPETAHKAVCRLHERDRARVPNERPVAKDPQLSSFAAVRRGESGWREKREKLVDAPLLVDDLLAQVGHLLFERPSADDHGGATTHTL
jgi:hypothetical protein